jgi:hypothetical protein
MVLNELNDDLDGVQSSVLRIASPSSPDAAFADGLPSIYVVPGSYFGYDDDKVLHRYNRAQVIAMVQEKFIGGDGVPDSSNHVVSTVIDDTTTLIVAYDGWQGTLPTRFHKYTTNLQWLPLSTIMHSNKVGSAQVLRQYVPTRKAIVEWYSTNRIVASLLDNNLYEFTGSGAGLAHIKNRLSSWSDDNLSEAMKNFTFESDLRRSRRSKKSRSRKSRKSKVAKKKKTKGRKKKSRSRSRSRSKPKAKARRSRSRSRGRRSKK